MLALYRDGPASRDRRARRPGHRAPGRLRRGRWQLLPPAPHRRPVPAGAAEGEHRGRAAAIRRAGRRGPCGLQAPRLAGVARARARRSGDARVARPRRTGGTRRGAPRRGRATVRWSRAWPAWRAACSTSCRCPRSWTRCWPRSRPAAPSPSRRRPPPTRSWRGSSSTPRAAPRAPGSSRWPAIWRRSSRVRRPILPLPHRSATGCSPASPPPRATSCSIPRSRSCWPRACGRSTRCGWSRCCATAPTRAGR